MSLTKDNIGFGGLACDLGRRVEISNHWRHVGKLGCDQRRAALVPDKGHNLGGAECLCQGVQDIPADVSCRSGSCRGVSQCAACTSSIYVHEDARHSVEADGRRDLSPRIKNQLVKDRIASSGNEFLY